MQIEFIGCTSAGKSTFIKALSTEATAAGSRVQTSYDYVLSRMRLSRLAPHPLRMLVLNLVALASAVIAYAGEPRLLRLTLTLLYKLPPEISLRERLKILRITSRNVGIHRIVATAPAATIILADEGNVQVVHYLFVHVRQPADLAVIDRYLAIVPLADLLVYYHQPQTVLVGRVMERGHKRIQPHTTEAVQAFVEHARCVFDHVAVSPVLADRLFVLDGQTNELLRQPKACSSANTMQPLLALLHRLAPQADVVRQY